MKSITLEQLAQDAGGVVDAAQNQRLVITRNGEPVAVLVGIQNKDAEDLALESSPEFWQMIEQRRSEPTMTLAEAEERLRSR